LFKRAIKLLEYNKIKKQLQNHAASSLGAERIEQLTPSDQLETVQSMLAETEEAYHVLRVRGHLPFGGITDVRAFLKRAQIGSVLAAKELMAISDVIRGSRIVKNFILETVEEQELNIPLLEGLARSMEPPVSLEKTISNCIDDQGYVMDGASDKLRGIRTQIRSFEGRIKDRLENIIRSSNTQKMLSESLVTIRGDRYVVPVKQEYRHAFGGIVHDQSASGATLFIEPQSVVDINNQLSEARAKEKHEIERILTELSSQVAVVAENILSDVESLAHIDFCYAKAKYGHSLKGSLPKLREDGRFKIKKARHPLIASENVVPIDMELIGDTHSVIITGPNTGGKTVTLKTVGLLTLMAQSGLFIPAEDGSEINVFERIFADIGDEQSIEQSLSTFSSHMTNIVSILENVNFKSLVLFDELGAGTDPQEGAALSIAILDDVFSRGATVIATTHYSELKAYAYERKGVENASVEFDVETLSPTYRLLMGVPGRSNAFEISKRLGLPERIIQESRSLIGADTAKIDKMIESLENSRKEAERLETEARQYKAESAQIKNELEEKINQFEKEKEGILRKAELEALERIEKAKREAYEIIDELRKLREGTSHVKEHELIDAKTRMDEAINSLSSETQKSGQSYKKKDTREFTPGQEVKIARFGQNGHIIEKINDHEYLVQIGIMKMNLASADLKAVKTEQGMKPIVNVKTSSTAPAKTELDLRGERFEEAMSRLDKFLDEALLAGYSRVSIIHGKGTGALRNGVKQKLKRHPRIKEARLGAFGEGDSGVTIVEFK
jgi:DNA mismatch repair protein MutS2